MVKRRFQMNLRWVARGVAEAWLAERRPTEGS